MGEVAPTTYPIDAGASYGLGSFIAAAAFTATASDSTANHCGGFTITDGSTAAHDADTAAKNVAQGDYLEIERAQAATGALVSVSDTYRLCGNVFNTALTGTAHTTVCSYATPFKVGVHFDEAESFDSQVADINDKIENTDYTSAGPDGPGHGYSGFWLDYFQVAC